MEQLRRNLHNLFKIIDSNPPKKNKRLLCSCTTTAYESLFCKRKEFFLLFFTYMEQLN